MLGCCKEYSHVSPGLEGCRTAVNHLPSCFCCLCAAFSSTKSVCSNVENPVEHSLLITELSVFGVNSSLIRQIVAFYKQLSSLGVSSLQCVEFNGNLQIQQNLCAVYRLHLTGFVSSIFVHSISKSWYLYNMWNDFFGESLSFNNTTQVVFFLF